MKRLIAFAFLALASCTPAMAAEDADKPSATAQVINHAIDKASDGLTQIAHALSTAAPQAWTLAVHGTYAQGLASIIVGGFCFAVSLLLATLSLIFGKCAKWGCNDGPYEWLCIIVGCAAIPFLIGTGVDLLDSDSWARIISPDGYLAQQILSKAL